MKRLTTLLVFLVALTCVHVAHAAQNWNGTSYTSQGSTFATLNNLPTSPGTLVYCSDCTQTTTCAGGGTGAWAAYQAGAWGCNLNGVTQSNPQGSTFGTVTTTNLTAGGGTEVITGASGNGSDNISNVNVNGVINVKDYGALGNGVHDDSSNINSAIVAARAAGSAIYMPKGTYLVTANDLNLTSSTGGIASGFLLYGAGPQSTEILCEDHNGNCVDTSGSDAFTIRDLFVSGGTSSANAPKTLLLLARVTNDGFGHYLSNVWTSSFGAYTIYDYGDEIAHWNAVRSNSPSAVISSCNSAGITSAYQTLVAAPTSMTVVNVYGGNFNTGGGINNCAVTFDDGCGTSVFGFDYNFYGTFIGEASGGGTAFCDKSGGVTPVLENISLINVRMEASDNNTAYKFLDFTKGGAYTAQLYMVNDMMSTTGTQANPVLAFTGCLDQSRIDLVPPAESGGKVLSASCTRGDSFYGLPESELPTTVPYGNNGGNGNFVQWFDGSSLGHVDAGGADAQNSVIGISGTTFGNVIWNMPMHGLYAKTVAMQFNSYENTTATAQTFTFPVTFTATPSAYGVCPTNGFAFNGATVTLPSSMSGTFTGNCFLGGN